MSEMQNKVISPRESEKQGEKDAFTLDDWNKKQQDQQKELDSLK
jgi:hypothetical protein